MVEEITFSIVGNHPTELRELQPMLEKFELQSDIKVTIEVIPTMVAGWSRMVDTALNHKGLDVSVVGNSWIGDLVSMNAVRPFEQNDLNAITKNKSYFRSVWQNCTRNDHGTERIYSIPWVCDSRAVFFRQDILQDAGVDEATAFVDADHFEQTMKTLKAKNVRIPLALPTKRSMLTVHHLASWIWGTGGDFFDRKGETARLAIDQPPTLEACKAFFRLGRYVIDGRYYDDSQANDAFASGKAAVTFGGSWIISSVAPQFQEHLKAALMPGIPFVGGDDLILWKHSQHIEAALAFIQFLISEEVEKWACPRSGLPTRENGWTRPPLNADNYQTLKKSIQRGHGFPNVGNWGLVEKRLTDAFPAIWTAVLADPDAETDPIVEAQLKTVAQRLRATIGV